MRTRMYLTVGVVAAVAAAGVAISFQKGEKPTSADSGSTGLIVSRNAIYVAEPVPSQTLSVAVVRLEKPGFVVVHEDAGGNPGEILGASGALPAGETGTLAPISLSRMTRDGEMLYVMLHLDDGDGTFDAVRDKPALDPVGNLPVMMVVTVSAEATEPGPVSL